MRAFVTRDSGDDRIYLELSPAELGALEWFRFNMNSGRSRLRNSVEEGLLSAIEGLRPENRERMRDVRRLSAYREGDTTGTTTRHVQELFPDPMDTVQVSEAQVPATEEVPFTWRVDNAMPSNTAFLMNITEATG